MLKGIGMEKRRGNVKGMVKGDGEGKGDDERKGDSEGGW